MKRLYQLLIAIILLFLTIIWANAPARAAVFTDLSGCWATSQIYRAAALDLVSGYPGGQFKPEHPLSRLEMMVMLMRASGYSLDQKKTSKSNPSPVTAPRVPWGQSYVDAAVSDQLLTASDLSDFKWDAAATRGQTALFLSRLLELPTTGSEEAASFTDLGNMSAEIRQAIAAVFAAGLMKGYEGGTFRPEQTITRAEAATLLSNLIDTNWVRVSSDRRLDGWVQNISYKGKTGQMELSSLQGTQQIRLSPDVKCFDNNVEIKAAQTVNCRVEVLLNQKKQAVWLTIRERGSTTGTSTTVTGSVKSVALGSDSTLILSDLDCQEQRLPLSSGATLEDTKGKTPSGGFKALKAQTFVKAYLTDGKVTKVSMLKTLTLSGTVMRFDSYRMYMSTSGSGNNRPGWFNYYDRARVVDKSGNRTGSVVRGDKVKVTYLDPDPNGIDDEIPLEIMINSRPAYRKVSGVVQSLSLSGSSPQITLKKNKIYYVDNSALSFFKSNTVSVGDKIEFMVDGADVVMEVTKVTAAG